MSANRSTYTFIAEDSDGRSITITCKGHLSQETHYGEDEVVHLINCDGWRITELIEA